MAAVMLFLRRYHSRASGASAKRRPVLGRWSRCLFNSCHINLIQSEYTQLRGGVNHPPAPFGLHAYPPAGGTVRADNHVQR